MGKLDPSATLERQSQERTTDADRIRFRRAGLIGAALAFAVFTWVLLAGEADLLRSDKYSDFFDAQARSLLEGRLDVDPDVLGIEGFVNDGKTYMYFGPWPAIIRMPVIALTDGLDGRLAAPSMLAAFVLALTYAVRLQWQIRALVRGAASVTRGELWATGAFTFLFGAGSLLLFLGSRLLVYHEASLWGVALAIVAFSYIVELLADPRPRLVVLATLFTTLAFLSRGSVGGGPLAAVAIVLLVRLASPLRERTTARLPRRLLDTISSVAPGRLPSVPALTAAVVVPIVLYTSINMARFDTPFSIPLDKQFFSQVDANRQRALAANDGSLFGLKFVPTNLAQFLRPDALDVEPLFPWVSFPREPAVVVGDVTFDTIDISSSIPSTMPVFTLLSVVGIVAIFRRPRDAEGRRMPAVLRAPALGAAGGAFLALTIAFLAHRYMADFLPFLLLTSAAGLQVLLTSRITLARRAVRRAVVGAFVAAAVLGVWTNFSLSLLFQRAYGPKIPAQTRAAFIGFRYDLYERSPGQSRPPYLLRGAELPEPERDTLAILDECEGLYFHDDLDWRGVERTNATGGFRFRIQFPDRDEGYEPLLVSGDRDRNTVLAVRYLPGDEISFVGSNPPPRDGWALEGKPVSVGDRAEHDLEVVFDWRTTEILVTLDGEIVYDHPFSFVARGEPLIGRNPLTSTTEPRFTGRVESLPMSLPECTTLAARLDPERAAPGAR